MKKKSHLFGILLLLATVAPATIAGRQLSTVTGITVGAPISGFLEELSVRVGDTVSSGQRVAAIQRSSPGEELHPGGAAWRRPVSTTGEYGDQLAIAGGLEPGEY